MVNQITSPLWTAVFSSAKGREQVEPGDNIPSGFKKTHDSWFQIELNLFVIYLSTANLFKLRGFIHKDNKFLPRVCHIMKILYEGKLSSIKGKKSDSRTENPDYWRAFYWRVLCFIF